MKAESLALPFLVCSACDLTVIFYQDQDLLKAATVKTEIRDSFLLNLYFFNAYNIPQLELVSHKSSLLGNKVKAFKINWDKTELKKKKKE